MKKQFWLWGTLLLGAVLMASPASASEKIPSSPGKQGSPGLLNHALKGVGTIVDSAVSGLDQTIDTGLKGLGSTLAPVEQLTVETLQKSGETVQTLLNSPDQPEVWAGKTLDRTVNTVEEVAHKATETTVKTTGELVQTVDQTLEAGVDTVKTGLEDSAAIVKEVKSSIPVLPDRQKQEHTEQNNVTETVISLPTPDSEELTSEPRDQTSPSTNQPTRKDRGEMKGKTDSKLAAATPIPKQETRKPLKLNKPIKRSVNLEKSVDSPQASTTTQNVVSSNSARPIENGYGMASGIFAVVAQNTTNGHSNTGGAGSGSGLMPMTSILPGWNTETERGPIFFWPGSLYAMNSQWIGEPGSPPPQHLSSLDDAQSQKLNEER